MYIYKNLTNFLPLKVFLYDDVASSVMAGPRSEHIEAGTTSIAKIYCHLKSKSKSIDKNNLGHSEKQ